MRLYRTSYKIPMNSAFLKFAWEGISLKGRNLEVENMGHLTSLMIDWEHESKTVTTNLVKEFDADFEKVMDEILDLQTQAIERGWIKC